MEHGPAQRTAAAVRAEMARQRITGAALARALGWSKTSLHRRLIGRTPFDVTELHAIAQHLTIPVAALVSHDDKAAS